MPLVRQPRTSAVLLFTAGAIALGACSKDDPVGVAEPCDLVSAETPVTLQPFEAARVSFEQRGTCANLSAEGARYLVVPQFATQFRRPSSTEYFLGNSELGADVRLASAARRRPGRSTAQSRLDARLRRIEGEHSAAAALLGRQLRERRAASLRLERAEGTTMSQFTPTRTFKTLGNTSGTSFHTVTATLRYSGANVVVYVDNAAPGGFSDEAINQLGPLFDQRLFPIATATFGEPSDIDDNDRVVVLMTPKVNALVTSTECQTDGFITGYFFGFDLASTGTNSNRGEVFYTLVPDPDGEFSCAHSVNQVVEDIVPSTFIHEMQHMISYNQHVILRGGEEEDTWLNEGLSLIAEETVSRFYEQQYPPPSGRENPGQMFPDSAQGFITNNLIYAYDYLANSPGVSVTTFESSGSLEERGAAFLFLRWLLDQKGEGLARQLVQSNLTGIENVAAKAGEPFEHLFGDFSVAVWTDSLIGVPRDAVPARYRFTSRNLRRLFGRLHEIGAVGPFAFPIIPAELPTRGGLTGGMVQGTMSHYVVESGDAAIPLHLVRSDQRELDPDLAPQVSVFRLP